MWDMLRMSLVGIAMHLECFSMTVAAAGLRVDSVRVWCRVAERVGCSHGGYLD